MHSRTYKSQDYKKLASSCEAIVLVSITLLLIAYFDYPKVQAQTRVFWLLIFSAVILLFALGSIIAAYRQIKVSRRAEKHSRFKISATLIDTLLAEKVPGDVLAGLERMIASDDLLVTGERRFICRLQRVLGKQRVAEVGSTIVKYARQ